MKPALLVIDVQNEFFLSGEKTKKSLEQAMEYINEAIKLFRRKKLPIICIQDIDRESGRIPGTDGFEIPEFLAIEEGDSRIHKTYGNAFNKTTLEEELKKRGADTLILTGFAAEFCVLSTYRGARDLDFTPIIFRGSLASGSEENIRFVESLSDIISYGALKKVLESCC